MLFSHPADFTPVCTTELGHIAGKAQEFFRRGVMLLGHSSDSVARHRAWIEDIRSQYNITGQFPYPVIGDESRIIAEQLDMTDMRDPESRGVRVVYIIGPDKTLRLSMLYPESTGRNVDEVLRVIDSLQLANTTPVVTPVDWRVKIIPTRSVYCNFELFSKCQLICRRWGKMYCFNPTFFPLTKHVCFLEVYAVLIFPVD
ncbi:peroxiredoxin-6-like isoform X3 [Athalia rosae]|nr:peroxiredoxin-6-like isoform X3 [Athalia rosae]